ncbi:MAG TPA: glycosyltransferase, partial [Mycobacteriales bacterium]|nr:glycosyltransferase [Mycobacteriales bacterium]
MRIAHFMLGRCNPDSANGIDKSVYYLTAAQAALGHTVSILSLSPKPALPVPGVETRTYDPLLRAGLPPSLWRDLRAWRPDLVHIHSLYVPANAMLAAALRHRGIPYAITPHGASDGHVLRRRALLKRPYRGLVELPSLNRAAFVHAIADESAIRSYGVTAPVVAAPNGIDASSVPGDLDGGAVRARLGLAPGTRLAVFLGRLDRDHKGLDLLVEALAEVRPTAPPLALVLVGPDREGSRQALEDLAARRGVAGDVVFWGGAYGREKFDLLAAADFFVQPSRWEAGVPLAVLEALCVGRPCLVSRPADPTSCIPRHGAGLVVEPTVAGVAAGLRQLAAASDETLAEQGRRAGLLARTEFTWPKAARTLTEAYARYTVRG